MRKLLCLSLFFLLLPVVVCAAPVVSPETLDYNFGEVAQGDKVDYTFRFRNSGDELLEITSVSSSCGCTAALLSSQRIAPGDTGEVKATFDSSRFRGQVTKTITLKTNAPEQRQVQFHLRGEVKELLSLSSNRVSWTWSAPEQVGNTRVTLQNHSTQRIVLSNARTTSGQIQFEIDRLELNPGETATLSVQGSLPEGQQRLNGYLLIDTDFQPMPQIRISIAGRLTK